jgi:hypothetical protein
MVLLFVDRSAAQRCGGGVLFLHRALPLLCGSAAAHACSYGVDDALC